MSSQEWIKRLELPPGELAILAAQVNGICRLGPGDFQPEKHIPEVTAIVRHLDPHLLAGSHARISTFGGNTTNASFSARETHTITDLGMSLPVPEGKEQPKEVVWFGNRDGIGIGSYIAEKLDHGKGLSSIFFTPFLDYARSQVDPVLSPLSEIVYWNTSLEPIELSREIPKMILFYRYYTSVPIWKKSSRT